MFLSCGFFPENELAEGGKGWRGRAEVSREYSISRRTYSSFDSDNTGVSDFNLAICEIRRGVLALARGSFLISLIFPVNIPHLFPIHHLSDV